METVTGTLLMVDSVASELTKSFVGKRQLPMDPHNVLKALLPGPFTRTIPYGVEHVFYNPQGCIIV